ncbi:hypothetical protein [Pontibacter mangrovi]|uniref:Uncharacterized protein n=1 Tax=Pontibacter mangrovi TaxID=2589816 RepID=A0A501WHU6_9BACT|nr:hypothetical protein [Pontibacter mangrovi]TPE45186.1 hypothetical protein FJM65_03870 [Pontibacter mangrovi]
MRPIYMLIGRFILLFMVVFCLTCQSTKQTEAIATEVKAEENQETEKIEFDKITITVVCACPGWNTKDVEVHKDGTIYYRLRNYETVGKNYKGQLGSVAMTQVYTLLKSLDFNSLKSGFPEAEDAADHSIHVELPDGLVQMRGDLDDKGALAVHMFLRFLDNYKMEVSDNRSFSTENEVRTAPPVRVSDKFNMQVDTLHP